MIGAGLLAKKAVERGLDVKPWVKTSLAPGSTVVTDYLEQSGLDEYLEQAQVRPRRLRLHDLHRQLGPALGRDLGGGQRQRPGRLRGALGQPQLRGPDQAGREGQLPRLAAARASPTRWPGGWTSTSNRAARHRQRRRADVYPPRHLAERRGDPATRSPTPSAPTCSRRTTANVFEGDERWKAIKVPDGDATPGTGLDLRAAAAVLRGDGRRARRGAEPITGARVLAKLGDSITTDHISPAGAIKKDSPAGQLADRARGRRPRLQLLRLAPRQPRGDDAGHVRQRPAPQPARRPRGRLDAPPARRRGDADLRRGDEVRRTRGCRWS